MHQQTTRWASLFFFLFTASAASASETFDVRCFDADRCDTDNDGYADIDAEGCTGSELFEDLGYDEHYACPEGYVLMAGDCDDDDDDIHPRQLESGNGVDDNCNGLVDEPEPIYMESTSLQRVDGFSVWMRIVDEDTRHALAENRKAVRVRSMVTPLSNTADKHLYVGKVKASLPVGAATFALVEIDDLDPATVYLATARFSGNDRSAFGSMYGVSYGESSSPYYAMTSSGDAEGRARMRVVQRGLYEYWQSQHLAEIGHMGIEDIDGTRFGAEVGEAWCSEFYSAVVDGELGGIGHRASVSEVVRYFTANNAYLVFPPAMVQLAGLMWMRPGDYVSVDTAGGGSPTHSAMFLAWDSATNTPITLDGNSVGRDSLTGSTRTGGNEVTVRYRPAGDLVGWGRLGPLID